MILYYNPVTAQAESPSLNVQEVPYGPRDSTPQRLGGLGVSNDLSGVWGPARSLLLAPAIKPSAGAGAAAARAEGGEAEGRESQSHVRKGIRRQGVGSFVRSSYVSTPCPVVICPCALLRELEGTASFSSAVYTLICVGGLCW